MPRYTFECTTPLDIDAHYLLLPDVLTVFLVQPVVATAQMNVASPT